MKGKVYISPRKQQKQLSVKGHSQACYILEEITLQCSGPSTGTAEMEPMKSWSLKFQEHTVSGFSLPAPMSQYYQNLVSLDL